MIEWQSTVLAIDSNIYYKLLSIVSTFWVLALTLRYLFLHFVPEIQIVRLFKHPHKSLMQNVCGVESVNLAARGKEFTKFCDDFVKNLSKSQRNAIFRLILKGKLVDNPHKAFGAGYLTNVYLARGITFIYADSMADLPSLTKNDS